MQEASSAVMTPKRTIETTRGETEYTRVLSGNPDCDFFREGFCRRILEELAQALVQVRLEHCRRGGGDLQRPAALKLDNRLSIELVQGSQIRFGAHPDGCFLLRNSCPDNRK